MRAFVRAAALALATLSTASSSPKTTDFKDDRDLFTFVSRPDIRAPRFNVTVHEPSRVAKGYWFVAPYTDLLSRLPTHLYQPGQVGPHIYDGLGNLVWSGAYLFGDRATFDFKVQRLAGEPHLSFILHEDAHDSNHRGGAGIILDSSFQIRNILHDTVGRGTLNMHELSITPADTALVITYASQLFEFSHVDFPSTWIGNNGFREADVLTGKTVFEWWALDHIDPTESLARQPSDSGSYASPWDCPHINSVDKNVDGDYLISARYTSTIYKISGKDGSILWRFGGIESDFDFDFKFSSQHDARFHQENSSHTTITFFNNGADEFHVSAKSSSAMLVSLNTETMTASILQQWIRPDLGLTRLRGNMQLLDSNAFVGWSENALISEFSAEGDCLLEAQFASHRFATYRAYKFDFTSQPSEQPAVVAHVYGTSADTSTTVFHASWNGATEIASWRFFEKTQSHESILVGSATVTGFETQFMALGHITQAYAEAVNQMGEVIATSAMITTQIPDSWKNSFKAPVESEDSKKLPEASAGISQKQDSLSLNLECPESSNTHNGRAGGTDHLTVAGIGVGFLCVWTILVAKTVQAYMRRHAGSGTSLKEYRYHTIDA